MNRFSSYSSIRLTRNRLLWAIEDSNLSLYFGVATVQQHSEWTNAAGFSSRIAQGNVQPRRPWATNEDLRKWSKLWKWNLISSFIWEQNFLLKWLKENSLCIPILQNRITLFLPNIRNCLPLHKQWTTAIYFIRLKLMDKSSRLITELKWSYTLYELFILLMNQMRWIQCEILIFFSLIFSDIHTCMS